MKRCFLLNSAKRNWNNNASEAEAKPLKMAAPNKVVIPNKSVIELVRR